MLAQITAILIQLFTVPDKEVEAPKFTTLNFMPDWGRAVREKVFPELVPVPEKLEEDVDVAEKVKAVFLSLSKGE